jgi:hypothetical protein
MMSEELGARLDESDPTVKRVTYRVTFRSKGASLPVSSEVKVIKAPDTLNDEPLESVETLNWRWPPHG